MNQEQTDVSVNAITDNQQITEHPLCNETEEAIKYYLRQSHLMYPAMSTDKSDEARLIILKRQAARLVEMLTLFERPWTEEIPVLQKACLSYLATESLSRKERQQVVEAWASWSDFQFRLIRYRDLLSRFLQYNRRIFQELERLISPADAGTSPEQQETTEEGGE